MRATTPRATPVAAVATRRDLEDDANEAVASRRSSNAPEFLKLCFDARLLASALNDSKLFCLVALRLRRLKTLGPSLTRSHLRSALHATWDFTIVVERWRGREELWARRRCASRRGRDDDARFGRVRSRKQMRGNMK